MIKALNSRFLLVIVFAAINVIIVYAEGFALFSNGSPVKINVINNEDNQVTAAIDLFIDDYNSVTGHKPNVIINNKLKKTIADEILIGTAGINSGFDKLLKKNKIIEKLTSKPESYVIKNIRFKEKNYLLVVGSDLNGTAYGIMHLSEYIGVSPWVWWADAAPQKKSEIFIPQNYDVFEYPSVRYRGIFLNDEDWGLMPWATMTLEPESEKGAIGPKAYERICQLLVRLKSNLLWPAMHECTKPFFKVKGNAEIAKKYGIYLGSSHCEPLLCNIAGEWDAKNYGDYNYAINSGKIYDYWKDRVALTKNSNAVYTIGMRGEHDGQMQGAKTVAEQKVLLQKAIDDQRKILKETIGKPLNEIPQAFIPYKEVLTVYDDGLNVPEDITLIWCDDNYGYISRLNNENEKLRSGGSGVYYHASYWGRPHDYLWLASTSPALIDFEMTRAWNNGAKNLWVLNVGDIKPAEYLTEYFLDLAWNVGKQTESQISGTPEYADHLEQFFAREFGEENANDLAQIMQEYYLLANQRKPEHMGWSRVEESAFPRGRTPVIDTEFNTEEALNRITRYLNIQNKAGIIGEKIDGFKRDAYFQLVAYPVNGASLLNQKLLYAQLSRQLFFTDSVVSEKYAAASKFAYEEIQRLTDHYNKGIQNGKWNLMMSSRPRDLYVFDPPALPEKFTNIAPKAISDPNVKLREAIANNSFIAINASSIVKNKRPSGLGHSGSALILKKGEEVSYNFSSDENEYVKISIYTLPNHAIDGGDKRYSVVLDNNFREEFNIKTTGRSEEWKLNVLRNQSVRSIIPGKINKGNHVLKIKALDNDIVLDQILVDFKKDRKFYLVDLYH